MYNEQTYTVEQLISNPDLLIALANKLKEKVNVQTSINNTTNYSNTYSIEYPNFGEIRYTFKENEVWFAGIDIAEALGFVRPSNTIHKLQTYDFAYLQSRKNSKRSKQSRTAIIPEEVVWHLAGRVHSVYGERFIQWFKHEALPTIKGVSEPKYDDTLIPANEFVHSLNTTMKALNRYLELKGVLVCSGKNFREVTPAYENKGYILFKVVPEKYEWNYKRKMFLTKKGVIFVKELIHADGLLNLSGHVKGSFGYCNVH